MKSYETEQKRLLVALFSAAPEKMFTAEEVAGILRGDDGEGEGDAAEDKHCSVSTVYRLISRLCDEGVLCKRAREGSRRFYYQYVRGGACESHLHLQCESCGRVIHLGDAASERMLLEVLDASGFQVDRARALVPGLCVSCRSEVAGK